jgi:hypothetical protein
MMLKRTLFTALATAATLAFATSARAAYLDLGTTNTSNATTTLTGNPAGAELLVKNTNGGSAGAFGLYGLLPAASPTASAAAVRGHNSSTNALGYGVWGSQAGSGTGVYGFTPSGKGVYGLSSSGLGVYGRHVSTSGTLAGVEGLTSSSDGNAAAVRGLNASTHTGNVAGYGVWGSYAGNGVGVYGSGTQTNSIGVRAAAPNTGLFATAGSPVSAGDGVSSLAGAAVWGDSASKAGVFGQSSNSYGVAGSSANTYGVYGQSSNSLGVEGYSPSHDGVYGVSSSGYGVHGYSTSSDGVYASSTSSAGVYASSSSGYGVYGESSNSNGVEGLSTSGYGVSGYTGGPGNAVNGYNSGTGYAGWFNGNVNITGTLTSGVKDFQIDDPLDPAHKYLRHTSVESSDMMDIYNGNVRTDGKGFATVQMPRWFQALNRSFRYQLTILGHAPWDTQARIWNEIRNNHFTIRTNHPDVRVSWQVTGIRHDPYANAHRTQAVAPKSKADRGNYLHPELYGKPRSDAIGYQKPPKAPQRLPAKR